MEQLNVTGSRAKGPRWHSAMHVQVVGARCGQQCTPSAQYLAPAPVTSCGAGAHAAVLLAQMGPWASVAGTHHKLCAALATGVLHILTLSGRPVYDMAPVMALNATSEEEVMPVWMPTCEVHGRGGHTHLMLVVHC